MGFPFTSLLSVHFVLHINDQFLSGYITMMVEWDSPKAQNLFEHMIEKKNNMSGVTCEIFFVLHWNK